MPEIQKRSLPVARMRWPKNWGDRAKYVFWRAYTPIHPAVRDVSLAARLVRHKGRQQYLIGTIKPGVPVKDLINYLISKGYGNHFVAWQDDDELVSLRRADDFRTQYHLRIFRDGEVRGHFEYTPEYRPISHLRKVGQEDRRTYFQELLKEWIVPA